MENLNFILVLLLVLGGFYFLVYNPQTALKEGFCCGPSKTRKLKSHILYEDDTKSRQ